ncbi:hypothetical protein [Clostridium sp. DJ247]|uniref:hypothetical protein n=1 Tax=Clostridium sp. DJ247 TaxID=2726188 RepID=UPI00162838C0|nr:hypothetical protein [Clostridium sp. DJ247]MBC2581313.1 hypothetical protein [Clostridium sp. DJ247]
MKNLYVYAPNYTSELERFCILLIEKELDIFFSACIKSAHAYSAAVSKSLSLHGKEVFEEQVLSSQEITELIQNIILKVNIEIKKNADYFHLTDLYIDLDENNYANDFLKETIENFRVTQITTKLCEDVIDSSISRILDGVCYNKIINNTLKRNISGKKILDKNNLENTKRKHQELIFKQIEGFLISTKISLRNELIKACILFINYIEDTHAASSTA